jgi:hypothetical protein
MKKIKSTTSFRHEFPNDLWFRFQEKLAKESAKQGKKITAPMRIEELIRNDIKQK